jgi:Tfp pilus assembly protein PilV
MGRSMKRGESGTSLIEVMIASLFLTVALTAVAMTMTQGVMSVTSVKTS